MDRLAPLRATLLQGAFAAALLAGAAPPAAVHAAAPPAPGPNLLAHGDAEGQPCTRDWSAQTPVAGWTVLRGAAAVLCYTAFHDAHEPVALPKGDAGRALLAAPGADTALAQEVEVGAASAAIDAGLVRYRLSGWLGGWHGRQERAVVVAHFLDAFGSATGSPAVLAEGPGVRTRTALVERAAEGRVPARTRHMVITVLFSGSLNGAHNAYADNLALRLEGAPEVRPATAAAPPRVPALDHLFVLMMENTNYADVLRPGKAGDTVTPRMPYFAALADQGVLLGNAWANFHPSNQNYVAMVAGDTFRSGEVVYPHFDLAERHLGDLLEAKGLAWRAYAQAMRKPCNLEFDPGEQGRYAPDNEPFVAFRNVVLDPARCKAHLRDLDELAADAASGTLPAFAWLAADAWWNGEGAWEEKTDVEFSLERQDEFLKNTLAPLLDAPAWRNARSLLVLTWDESLGWGWPDNRIPTVLVGSPGLLRAGTTLDDHFDGYSVLKTTEQALGLPDLGRFDVPAVSLARAFASVDHGPGPAAAEPGFQFSEAQLTRGTVFETFGRVAVAAAAPAGAPLDVVMDARYVGHASISITPLGEVPASAARAARADPDSHHVILDTTALPPGDYAVWLRDEHGGYAHPPRTLTLQAAPLVTPATPGVEVVDAPLAGSAQSPLHVRGGTNVILHYCRPAVGDAESMWVGIFPETTPGDRLSRKEAAKLSNPLRVPGSTQPAGAAAALARCSDAMAFTAELPPDRSYAVRLVRDSADGTARAEGQAAHLRIEVANP